MHKPLTTHAQLIEELARLRERVAELETVAAERRQTEEALRVSEENFRNLVENIQDGIIIATADGRHVYANRHAAEILGYTPAEILQTTQRDLADPAAYPLLQQRLQDRIAGRPVPDTYETIIRRKDGASFHADITGTKTIWHGQPSDLVIFRDITERSRIEEALSESEEKFRSIIEFAEDGIMLTNENGLIIEWNPAQERIIGQSRASVIGRPIWDVQFHSALAAQKTAAAYEQLKAFILHLLDSGQVPEPLRRLERMLQNELGELRIVQSLVFSIRTAHGFRLASISRDISAEKQMESALQESERKLKALFELLPVGVSVLDAENRVVYVNPALEKILDIHHAALLQGAYRQRTYLRGDGTVMPVEEFASARAARAQSAVYNVETGVVKEDGRLVWTNINAVPVDFPDWRIVIATTDITARKQAEEKIRLLNIELEQMAMTDSMTNLFNRRYFMQRGGEEIKRTKRSGHPLTLLLLDIDHFKRVNDSHGHEAGDLVLQQMAEVMKTSLREIDILGRIGGEEFAILLPDTGLTGAVQLAEWLRQSIANLSFKTPDNCLNLTVSVGAAAYTEEIPDIDTLLNQADRALYRAKNSGRNRVET